MIEAEKRLGVLDNINFWIFSNNKNPKIPKSDLHAALLKAGNADSVKADGVTKHIFTIGSNDGTQKKNKDEPTFSDTVG